MRFAAVGSPFNKDDIDQTCSRCLEGGGWVACATRPLRWCRRIPNTSVPGKHSSSTSYVWLALPADNEWLMWRLCACAPPPAVFVECRYLRCPSVLLRQFCLSFVVVLVSLVSAMVRRVCFSLMGCRCVKVCSDEFKCTKGGCSQKDQLHSCTAHALAGSVLIFCHPTLLYPTIHASKLG